MKHRTKMYFQLKLSNLFRIKEQLEQTCCTEFGHVSDVSSGKVSLGTMCFMCIKRGTHKKNTMWMAQDS